MAETRFERERAAWVLSRAGRRAANRRRGELLAQRARRMNRDVVGAGESGFGEVVTRGRIYRSVFREDGAGNTLGWAAWTSIWVFWTVLLLGPALVLAGLTYGLWWALVPRVGHLRPWPYVVAAGACASVGAAAWTVWRPQGWAALLWAYLLAQVVLGFLRAAYLVRANGWSVVQKKAKASGANIEAVHIDVPATAPMPVEPVEVAVPEVSADELDLWPDEADELDAEWSSDEHNDIEPIDVGLQHDNHESEVSR